MLANQRAAAFIVLEIIALNIRLSTRRITADVEWGKHKACFATNKTRAKWRECVADYNVSVYVSDMPTKSTKQLLDANYSYCDDVVNFYSSSAVRQHSILMHFKDVYACSGSFIANETHILDFWDPSWLNFIRYEHSMKTLPESIDNAVFIFSLWSFIYGHFLVDILAGIVQIPEEIISKSKIIIDYNKKDATEFLAILGITEDRIVFAKNEWIFCSNLYTMTSPEVFLGNFIHGVPMLRDKIRKSLNLINVKQTDFVLMNRKGNRNIENIEDTLDYLKLKYPNDGWIYKDFRMKTAKETIEMYSKIKIIVLPIGSGCYNSIFMHNNSAILSLSGRMFEPGFFILAALNGIWATSLRNNWGYFDGRGGKVSHPVVLELVAKLKYAQNNGRWPSGWNAIRAFDYDDIMQKIGPYPYTKIEFFDIKKIRKINMSIPADRRRLYVTSE